MRGTDPLLFLLSALFPFRPLEELDELFAGLLDEERSARRMVVSGIVSVLDLLDVR